MMQSQQAYTKDIKLGDSEVLVVENEEQVLCHTDSKTRYCVLGSTHHVEALKRKIRELSEKSHYLQSERDDLVRKTENIEAEMKQYRSELSHVLDKEDSVLKRRHHTEDVFGETSISIIESIENDSHHGAKDQRRHLPFHLPTIRQYYKGGKLYREERERKTSWTELFWDLVFVGVVSVLAHHLAEHPSGHALFEYSLLFAAFLKIWSDVNYWLNFTASDDSSHKVFLLWHMFLTLGLIVNTTNAFTTTGVTFAIIYGVVKLTRALSFVILYFRNREFLINITLLTSTTMAFSLCWFLSCFFSHSTRTWFWLILVILDQFSLILIIFSMLKVFPNSHKIALNIEHQTERAGLFLLIMLGEAVIACLFENTKEGLDLKFLRAILVLLLAYDLHWIYFTADGSKKYMHAIRRHAVTAFVWNIIHIPLYLSVAAAGRALSYLVAEKATPSIVWLFCGSSGAAMICMVIIALTHKEVDPTEAVYVRKGFRMFFRLLIAVLWLCTPLITMNPTAILLIVSLTSLILLISEAFGRLVQPQL